MEIRPGQSAVFVVADEEQRRLVYDGPAIIDAHGNRFDVPPKVLEALLYVESAMRHGHAVRVTALPPHLPLTEAADASGMSEPELRALVEAGEIEVRREQASEVVELADVLAVQEHHNAQRRLVLHEMLREDDGRDV